MWVKGVSLKNKKINNRINRFCDGPHILVDTVLWLILNSNSDLQPK